MMIPGYAAWASVGTTTEVISSAGSDIVLTLVGGKVVKVVWAGTKALVNGAARLGAKLTAGELRLWRDVLRDNLSFMLAKHLGIKPDRK